MGFLEDTTDAVSSGDTEDKYFWIGLAILVSVFLLLVALITGCCIWRRWQKEDRYKQQMNNKFDVSDIVRNTLERDSSVPPSSSGTDAHVRVQMPEGRRDGAPARTPGKDSPLPYKSPPFGLNKRDQHSTPGTGNSHARPPRPTPSRGPADSAYGGPSEEIQPASGSVPRYPRSRNTGPLATSSYEQPCNSTELWAATGGGRMWSGPRPKASNSVPFYEPGSESSGVLQNPTTLHDVLNRHRQSPTRQSSSPESQGSKPFVPEPAERRDSRNAYLPRSSPGSGQRQYSPQPYPASIPDQRGIMPIAAHVRLAQSWRSDFNIFNSDAPQKDVQALYQAGVRLWVLRRREPDEYRAIQRIYNLTSPYSSHAVHVDQINRNDISVLNTPLLTEHEELICVDMAKPEGVWMQVAPQFEGRESRGTWLHLFEGHVLLLPRNCVYKLQLPADAFAGLVRATVCV